MQESIEPLYVTGPPAVNCPLAFHQTRTRHNGGGFFPDITITANVYNLSRYRYASATSMGFAGQIQPCSDLHQTGDRVVVQVTFKISGDVKFDFEMMRANYPWFDEGFERTIAKAINDNQLCATRCFEYDVFFELEGHVIRDAVNGIYLEELGMTIWDPRYRDNIVLTQHRTQQQTLFKGRDVEEHLSFGTVSTYVSSSKRAKRLYYRVRNEIEFLEPVQDPERADGIYIRKYGAREGTLLFENDVHVKYIAPEDYREYGFFLDIERLRVSMGADPKDKDDQDRFYALFDHDYVSITERKLALDIRRLELEGRKLDVDGLKVGNERSRINDEREIMAALGPLGKWLRIGVDYLGRIASLTNHVSTARTNYQKVKSSYDQ